MLCTFKKKPVMCIETGIVYSSISETARAFNVTKESISGHLHGKCKTIKNMHFKFVDKVNPPEQMTRFFETNDYHELIAEEQITGLE